MSTDNIESGAAGIVIELSEGRITVTHKDDGALLAHLDNAPSGTWTKIWNHLDFLGFLTNQEQHK